MCAFREKPILFAGYPQLSEKDIETIDKYAGNDPVIKQLIIYAARAKCVRECKAKKLSPTLQYPDPEILDRFKQREPYSFLHYAYYQVRRKRGGYEWICTSSFLLICVCVCVCAVGGL